MSREFMSRLEEVTAEVFPDGPTRRMSSVVRAIVREKLGMPPKDQAAHECVRQWRETQATACDEPVAENTMGLDF